ncbi:hypothetical protein [Herbaspirillum camelliae]|uniref:hypothetical protein n=1 Tax=Herbaspirillum camelliae TaxID=1892903 RepID=UPI000949CC50|nr:hypothetical protein [Herbaspirillum camelliae]
MEGIEAIMQYAIYAALGVCMLGLLAAIGLFIAVERRWAQRRQQEVENFRASRLALLRRVDAGLSLRPWEELCNRIGEMQIVGEEGDRPAPYKNVA